MHFDSDTLLGVLWIGLFLTSISLLSRKASDFLYVFIFWFAIFPIPAGIIQDTFHKVYQAHPHPEKLWLLACVAILPYLLAVFIVVIRVKRHACKKHAALAKK